jgi:hypothetical protein
MFLFSPKRSFMKNAVAPSRDILVVMPYENVKMKEKIIAETLDKMDEEE